ncbi:MAG: hypothetical protein ABJM29_09740 [Rhizobiaceae bacterium]
MAPLSQSEIRLQLFGKSLIGEYANGATWSENLSADLTSFYVEGEKQMVGEMHFNGSILCFTYRQSENPTPNCFEIWKRGVNCFDFYESDQTIPLMDRRVGRGWVARAWRSDQTSSCQSDLLS